MFNNLQPMSESVGSPTGIHPGGPSRGRLQVLVRPITYSQVNGIIPPHFYLVR